MKKHLLAFFALVVLLTLNVLNAKAQTVSCDCATIPGVNAGTPVGPANPVFTLGTSTAADIAATSIPTDAETNRTDYVFIVTDATGLVLGFTDDGSFDFNGYAPGTYNVEGFAYNQAQLDAVKALVCNPALQGVICGLFPAGVDCPAVLAELCPQDFTLDVLAGFLENLSGTPLLYDSLIVRINDLACVAPAGSLINVCYATTNSPAYTIEVVEGGSSNDECDGATALDLSGPNGPFDNTTATGAGIVDNCFGEGDFGGAGPSDDNSLWFSFTGDGGVWHVYTTPNCGDGVDLLAEGTYIEGGDTQMELFTGTCGDLTSADCNEDDLAYGAVSPDGPGYFAGLTVATEAGVTYYVMVDGFDGSAGQYCISAEAEPCGSVTTVAPETIDLCPNATADISIDAATFDLGWELNGNTPAPLFYILNADFTQALGIVAGTSADGLTLTLDGANPPVADAQFIVLPVLASNLLENGGQTFPQIDGNCDSNFGSPVLVTILAAGDPACDAVVPPANDECANAIGLDVTDGTINGPFSNTNATGETDAIPAECFTDDASADPLDNFYDNSVWFTFTGTGENITLTTDITGIDSTAANLDTQIAVYAMGCDGAEVGCSDDVDTDGGNYLSSVTIATEAGTMYYVVVDGYYYNSLNGGYFGDFNIAVSAEAVQPTCDADFGTVTAPANTTIACGGTNEAPTATGAAAGDFTSAWVLTQGVDLVIINFNASGVFDFTGLPAGLYTVHAFNYSNDDLATILGAVQFGTTTGADAAGLIAAGAICAELDVAGVQYTLEDCAPTCDADFGTVANPDAQIVCAGGSNAAITVTGGATGDYSTIFALTSVPDLTIQAINTGGSVFDFTGLPAGNYKVHAFNFLTEQAATILAAVQLGQTTGFDVAGLIAAGTICADLDVAGVNVTLLAPLSFNLVTNCGADDETPTLILAPSGGLPEIDSEATYTLAGTINAEIHYGDTPINQTFGDDITYNFTLTDGVCGTITNTGDITCTKCHNEAGIMGAADISCTGIVSATATDFVIDEGSVLIYALHTSADTIPGDILAANTTGTFDLSSTPGVVEGVTYYISAVVGRDEDGDGNIDDLTNYCTRVAAGAPVVYNPCPPECNNFAGTMSAVTSPAVSCDGIASAVSTGETIEEGSVLIYALHTNAGASAGDILAANTTGVFELSALGTQGTTYYISAVIGRDGDGNGQIDDLGGFCTVVTPGLPVSYSELVLSVDYICQDLLADFTISASGGSGSYAISGNLYSGPFTAGQAPILVLDKDDATYNVTATDGNGCTDTYSVLTTCKTVPIEWLTFTGEVISTGNLLKWSVIEQNNDYFVVERSVDGATWTALATVDGIGTSSNPTQYQYEDKTAPEGLAYYRIKQVDFNSDLSYSNTINLTRGETKFGITSLSPVPATNTLTIAFNTVTNNTVKVSVYDAIGKLITAEQVVVGATTHTLNVNNYASGMYFMTLTDGTTTVTTKFVKQ
jgi:hypothetical protein